MNSEKEGSIGPSGNIWKGNLPGLGFLEALVEEVTFMLGLWYGSMEQRVGSRADRFSHHLVEIFTLLLFQSTPLRRGCGHSCPHPHRPLNL